MPVGVRLQHADGNLEVVSFRPGTGVPKALSTLDPQHRITADVTSYQGCVLPFVGPIADLSMRPTLPVGKSTLGAIVHYGLQFTAARADLNGKSLELLNADENVVLRLVLSNFEDLRSGREAKGNLDVLQNGVLEEALIKAHVRFDDFVFYVSVSELPN